MIVSKTRNGIILLAVLTATVFWLGRSSQERSAPPITGLDTKLDYALRQFEARYFDADGRQAARMWAPILTNDAVSGVAVVENPRFEVMHEGSLWNIIAESATVAADRERILLAGKVNMRRMAPDSLEWLEVNTSEMTLEVTARVAHSDQPVVIMDDNSTMEAVGFSIDMRDDSFHLDDQVKGRYDIN